MQVGKPAVQRLQPRGVGRIDWDNPITQGLVFAFLPDDYGWTANGGAIARSAFSSKVGSAVSREFVSASNQAYTKSGTHGNVTTMLAVAYSTTASVNRALMSTGASTNDRRLLYITSADQLAMFVGNAAGTTVQASGGSLGATRAPRVFAGTYDGSSAQVFIDGLSAGTAAGSVTPAAPTTYAVGGYYTSGALNSSFALPGGIGLAALWNRVLSSAELLALAENPWQIFEATGQLGSLWALQAVASNPSASVAVTDGADVLAASIDPIVAASSATTDGADVLASNVSVIVEVSSATTDGADVLAGNITVGSAGPSVSVAVTDGADVLAGAVGPIVAASSATTDGADALAGNVSPIVAASSATTDGADVLLANVSPLDTVGFSGALADGADVLVAAIDSGSSGAGRYPEWDKPKKKRFVVEVDGKLSEFSSAAQAARALDKQVKDKPEPIAEVPLAVVAKVARASDAERVFKAEKKAKNWDSLLKQYESWIEDQEEEELLLLL